MNAMTTLAYSYTYSSNPKVQAVFERKLKESSEKAKTVYTLEDNNQRKCKFISEKEAFEIQMDQMQKSLVFKK